MKKKFLVLIVAIMVCSISLFASLSFVSAEEEVLDKKVFSEQAEQQYNEILNDQAVVYSISETDYFSEMDRDELYFYIIENYPDNTEEILNKAGFFTYSKGSDYETAINKKGISTYSNANSPQDVVLTSPTVTYDANTSSWKISVSGKWKNDNWNTQNMGSLWNGAGKTTPLGGCDLYGFEFANTTRNYDQLGVHIKNAYVECNPVKIYKKSGKNYVYDRTFQEKGNTINKASGKTGVLMEVNDYLVATHSDWAWYDYTYGAKTFNVAVNYSKEFENFHGFVSTCMHHNYSKTIVTSVTATDNGFSINFDEKKYGWTAYSSTQTKF